MSVLGEVGARLGRPRRSRSGARRPTARTCAGSPSSRTAQPLIACGETCVEEAAAGDRRRVLRARGADAAACPSRTSVSRRICSRSNGAQRGGVAQEQVVGLRDVVVLACASRTRSSVVDEAALALFEHLAQAVRLAADRVVAQQEAQREEAAPGEAHVVPAFGELEARAARPSSTCAACRSYSAGSSQRVEVLARVHPVAEGVVDRGEVQHAEVDRGCSRRGRPSGSRRAATCRATAPRGSRRRRGGRTSRRPARARARACAPAALSTRLCRRSSSRARSARSPAARGRASAARAATVSSVEPSSIRYGPDAVRRQVLEHRLDDVGLVVGRDQRDDAEGVVEQAGGEAGRQRRAALPAARRGPGRGAALRRRSDGRGGPTAARRAPARAAAGSASVTRHSGIRRPSVSSAATAARRARADDARRDAQPEAAALGVLDVGERLGDVRRARGRPARAAAARRRRARARARAAPRPTAPSRRSAGRRRARRRRAGRGGGRRAAARAAAAPTRDDARRPGVAAGGGLPDGLDEEALQRSVVERDDVGNGLAVSPARELVRPARSRLCAAAPRRTRGTNSVRE